MICIEEVGQETILRLVSNWISRQDGRAFCDRCIASMLALADHDQVDHATMTLSGNGYDRTWGNCRGCGDQTTVTALVRMV